ncbi:MAG: peptide-binding protein [Lentisphaeria bacterium]|nr:peptide-binding protein [Lentisphaeria bacterium]
MQKHGNGLLTGISAALLIAVIFFGISITTSTDRYRFALEDFRRTLQDLQDQSPATPAAMPAQERKVLQKEIADTLELLREVTDKNSRHISVKSKNTHDIGPLLSAATEKLEALSARLSDAGGDAVIPGANARFYDPAAISGDRMVTAIPTDIGNLNPLTSNEATVSSFWALANAALTERNLENPDHFEPLLAESWTESADHLTWRIKLRKGILWHDFTDPVTGKEWKNVPVTASDFKFYVDAVKNPDVDCAPLRGYLGGIKEVRILNDREFEVVWNTPYFLAREITLGLTPLPRHFYHAYEGPFDGKRFNDDNARNRMIVGCGPYRMTQWERGKHVVFQRFEKYFGRFCGIMPPIRTCVFRIIQHPSTRLQALISGDIDRNSLTPEQWLNNTSSAPFQDGTIRKLQYPSMSFNYIGLNLKNPLFKDRRVRVALSHLIHRERLKNDVFHGLAHPVSGTFFMDSPAYDKSILPYPFDVVKAKAMLNDAGWRDTDGDGILDKDGQPFKFTLIFPGSNPNYVRMAPILKEDFAAAGVQLELLSMEWSVVIQRMEQRNFEAVMAGWTTPLTSDPYQLWHSDNASAAGSSNFISFADPEADKLIEQIRSSFDDAARNRAYHQFHKLLHEEQPYLFLFSQNNLLGISGRYKNLRVFPLGVENQILWTPRGQQKTVSGL